MAFSRFDEKLIFPLSLDNFGSLEQPVDLAIERMCLILETQKNKLREFIREMLQNPSNKAFADLSDNSHQRWHKTGQEFIVLEVLNLGKKFR